MPSDEGIRCFVTGSGGSLETAGELVSDKILVTPIQTHSLNVGIVTDPTQVFPDTDALITTLPEVALGIRTADCVPVLFYSPDIRAIAAAHAGWKGTLGGIVDRVVDTLSNMGAEPGEIRVVFSVSICGRCYEVDRELADKFAEAGFKDCISMEEGQKPHIDLQGVNAMRLISKGVREEHIYMNPYCTKCACSEDGDFPFNSWRRQAGIYERNYSIICLKI